MADETKTENSAGQNGDVNGHVAADEPKEEVKNGKPEVGDQKPEVKPKMEEKPVKRDLDDSDDESPAG